MDSKEGPSWDVITEVVPGVRAVRFATFSTRLIADSAAYRPLWDSLLEEVREGDLIILTFREVRFYDTAFLGSLLSAHKRELRAGAVGPLIFCELCDDLKLIWTVSGPRQPLDSDFNYVATEEKAVEKAKRLIEMQKR